MKTGIELITNERIRQIKVEGWSAEHDKQHTEGELALVAICYAMPIRLYQFEKGLTGFHFIDPFPDWNRKWDKRYYYGENRTNPGNALPDPATYTQEERIDLLIKAGALLAAEIDRLQKVKL